MYLLQNMYNAGTSQRTVSFNTHYNMVFKNPRDPRQIRCLASQIHPGDVYWLIGALLDATDKPHGHLVMDQSPKTDHDKRVVLNILQGEYLTYYSTH